MTTGRLDDRSYPTGTGALQTTDPQSGTAPLKPLAFPTSTAPEIASQDTVQTSLRAGKTNAAQAPQMVTFTESGTSQAGGLSFPDPQVSKQQQEFREKLNQENQRLSQLLDQLPAPTTALGQALEKEVTSRQPALNKEAFKQQLPEMQQNLAMGLALGQRFEVALQNQLLDKGEPLGKLLEDLWTLQSGYNTTAKLDDILLIKLEALNELLSPLITLSQPEGTEELRIRDLTGNSYDSTAFLALLLTKSRDNSARLLEIAQKRPELSAEVPAACHNQERLASTIANMNLDKSADNAGEQSRAALDFLKKVEGDLHQGTSLEDACLHHFDPSIFGENHPIQIFREPSGAASFRLMTFENASGWKPVSANELIRLMSQTASYHRERLTTEAQTAHTSLDKLKDYQGQDVGPRLQEVEQLADSLLQEKQKLDELTAASKPKREEVERSEQEVETLDAEVQGRQDTVTRLDTLNQALAAGKSPEEALRLANLSPQALAKLGLRKNGARWELNGKPLGRQALQAVLGEALNAERGQLAASTQQLSQKRSELLRQREELANLEKALLQQRQVVADAQAQLKAKREALEQDPEAASHPDYDRIMAKSGGALEQAENALHKADQEINALGQTLGKLDALLDRSGDRLQKAELLKQGKTRRSTRPLASLLDMARSLAARPGPISQEDPQALVSIREMTQLAREQKAQTRNLLLAEFAATMIENRMLQDHKSRQDQQSQHQLQRLQNLVEEYHKACSLNPEQDLESTSGMPDKPAWQLPDELLAALKPLESLLGPQALTLLTTGA
ncbi:MAG TPA: hypothetical protein V6D23_08210 [Candidatus Obscuribacterales bacterium]